MVSWLNTRENTQVKRGCLVSRAFTKQVFSKSAGNIKRGWKHVVVEKRRKTSNQSRRVQENTLYISCKKENL